MGEFEVCGEIGRGGMITSQWHTIRISIEEWEHLGFSTTSFSYHTVGLRMGGGVVAVDERVVSPSLPLPSLPLMAAGGGAGILRQPPNSPSSSPVTSSHGREEGEGGKGLEKGGLADLKHPPKQPLITPVTSWWGGGGG